ncbi:MAG: hypothetical protein NZ898_09295 [Myxococcota bacterium]|nr:hypothetical protein [Myxococcota bacterium]MDW8361628.1 hypothetical protein [Myxococcales bacterium]
MRERMGASGSTPTTPDDAPRTATADPPVEPTSTPERRPVVDDLLFVNALSACAQMQELSGPELSRIASRLVGEPGPSRRIDLLEAYYAAEGRVSDAERRRRDDRFLLVRAEEGLGAPEIVARMAALAPDLQELVLERIGDPVDGQLVLRSGDDVVAVVDDEEVYLETGEIDLRTLEARPTTTVRSLVRAFNRMLARRGEVRRLIPLRSDETREVYLAFSYEQAVMLLQSGYLDDEDPDELREMGGW